MITGASLRSSTVYQDSTRWKTGKIRDGDGSRYNSYFNHDNDNKDNDVDDQLMKDPIPDDEGCGLGSIYDCPPAYYYPDFDNILNGYPSVTLHPSDFLLGSPLTGIAPVYSADGTIIGYFEIVNTPSLVNPNWEADGTITDWQSIYINAAAWMVSSMGYCPACAPAVTVITIVDVSNQTIEIHTNPQVGSMVPVHPVPYPQLPDMPDPFTSHR